MAEPEINALAGVQGEIPAIPPAEEPAATPLIDEPPDPAQLEAERAAAEAEKEAAAKRNKDELARLQRRKARDEAAYWQRKNEQAAREAETTPAAPAAQSAEPQEGDFQDYTEFVRAHSGWAADQAVATARKGWDKEQADKAENATHQAKMQKMQDNINAGYGKYSDFEDVAMAPTTPITPMIMDILADTENPADIAYHMGKNQTQAIQIGRMAPRAAAMEIAKISAELAGATPAAGTPTPPKPTTNAPPPITPVGSGNPAAEKDPEDMTQAEFEAYRQKQGAKPY